MTNDVNKHTNNIYNKKQIEIVIITLNADLVEKNLFAVFNPRTAIGIDVIRKHKVTIQRLDNRYLLNSPIVIKDNIAKDKVNKK